MSSHARRLHQTSRNQILGVALALALGTCAGTADAARLGHARVVSAPGAPLQVVVPLLELTPDEAANLQVSLASEEAWRQAGLQPPAPLSTTTARLESGPNAASRVVRISSTQPLTTEAVDILLDLRSNAGQRQLQVTVLVPARDAAAGVRRAATGPAAVPSATGGGQVVVRPGQTLWGVASSHAVADATIYQMLVALWRANPQAFIQNNMNLVRAGARLSIPDAATVRAIDPEEAQRIFAEQVAAYQRGRGRAGAGGGQALPQGRSAAAGKVEPGQTQSGASASQPQDQLRLSSAASGGASAPAGAGGGGDAAADQRAADQRALDEARQRVEELKSNVEALGRAVDGQQGGAAGAAGQAGAGQAAGAGSGSSSGPASAGGVSGAAATGTGQAPDASAAGASVPATPSAAGESASPAQPSGGAAAAKSGMPSWLSENLLAIVTAVLAVVIFVVAWVLRRAGQRRSEEEEAYDYAEPSVGVSTSDLDQKLSSINLDLDHPPSDEATSSSRP